MVRRSDRSRFTVNVKPRETPANAADFASAWHPRCVVLYDELIPYIVELLHIFEYKERWTGDETTKRIMSSLWTDCIHRLSLAEDCDMSLQLRQNPGNHCQLQQSFNGGLSWSLAFDYSLCSNPATNYLVEQQIFNQFEQWHDAESIPDINPSAPDDTFSSSEGDSPETVEYRKLALCAATKLYIDLYCESIKAINADVSTLANLTNLAIGAVVALGTAGAIFSFGTSTLLSMGIAAALGALGTAGYSALTEGVLSDTAAREELACCMYLALRDAEINQANFAVAFEGCESLSANAELIRSTLTVDISNPAGLENQFNAFVNLLGESLRPAQLGLITDCPCEPPEAAIPVFTADWDGFDGLGGTDLTDLGAGYWEATSAFVEDHYSLAIQEATGADFYLTDVTYPDGGSVSCEQSRFEGVDEVRCDDEPAPPEYDRYGWTWLAVEGPRRVRFQIALAV